MSELIKEARNKQLDRLCESLGYKRRRGESGARYRARVRRRLRLSPIMGTRSSMVASAEDVLHDSVDVGFSEQRMKVTITLHQPWWRCFFPLCLLDVPKVKEQLRDSAPAYVERDVAIKLRWPWSPRIQDASQG